MKPRYLIVWLSTRSDQKRWFGDRFPEGSVLSHKFHKLNSTGPSGGPPFAVIVDKDKMPAHPLYNPIHADPYFMDKAIAITKSMFL